MNAHEYVNEMKKMFWTQYQIKPKMMTHDGEPIYQERDIPDGEYPMDILGKKDLIKVCDGKVSAGNFAERERLDAMSPKEKIERYARSCADRLFAEGKIKTIWDVRIHALKLGTNRFNEMTSDHKTFVRAFVRQCFCIEPCILKESIRTLPGEVYSLLRAELGRFRG